MNKSSPYTDPELLSRITSHDRKAFNELFERFYPALFQLAYGIVDNQTEAEDVVAEIFIKLWKSPRHFHFMGELVNWLRLTTRNAALDILKHRKVRNEKQQDVIRELYTTEDFTTNEMYAEIIREIYHHIEQLPSKSREIFKLRYIDGLKNEEIATLLGIKNQSIRDHLVRSLKILRLTILKKEYFFSFFLFFINTK